MRIIITEKQHQILNYLMKKNNIKESEDKSSHMIYTIVRDFENDVFTIKLIDQNENPPFSGSKRFKDKIDAENFLKIINGIKQIKR